VEKKWKYNETVHQPLVDFKKACDSFRRDVLFSYEVLGTYETTLILRLIEMCNIVYIGKHLSDHFPTKNGLT
jgi:hypothetical protein